MAWKIELDPGVERELSKLDPPLLDAFLGFSETVSRPWMIRAVLARHSKAQSSGTSGSTV